MTIRPERSGASGGRVVGGLWVDVEEAPEPADDLEGLGVVAVVEAAADGGLGAGQVIRRLWCFLEVDPPTADDTPDPRSES